MANSLPDPRAAAEREARDIAANPDLYFKAPLDRVLADAPFIDRAALLDGLDAFHRERMQKIPSRATYPESAPWVEHVLARDRELQRAAGLTGAQMAMLRSMGDFLRYHGFVHAAAAPARAPGVERCRVVYAPESDHGRLHVKNVDDPVTYWRPEPRPTWLFPRPGQTLWADGVGSGLHLDDEPDEIFPLPVFEMYGHHCDDVPGAVEFLTRYSKFWGSRNMLFHDRQKRSAAIEKCSHNFIEVFHPGANGATYISGMSCRDPQSPQGRYQRAQRQKYLRLFKRGDDCADNAFWAMAWQFEQKLAGYVASMRRPARLDDLVTLFTTPWPRGLCKTGTRLHAEQGLIGYTLISYVILLDEGKLFRRQRAGAPGYEYPDQPEVFEFEPAEDAAVRT